MDKLIDDTLALVTSKQVTNFTAELADEIMANEAVVQDLFLRVSAIEQSSQSEQAEFIQKAIKHNSFNKRITKLLASVALTTEFDEHYQAIFKEWGLTALNTQQLLLCQLSEQVDFFVVNPGLGMGKSTYIAFKSIHTARNEKGSVVIVLNSDATLLFRDYQKVNSIVQQLQQRYSGFNFSVEQIDVATSFKQKT